MRLSAVLLPTTLLSALLSGCGVDVVSTATSPRHLAITGSVFGGAQPISSSHIYLYAANTTGYGGSGIAPSTNNASLSLLTAGTNTSVDGNGNYYVTSGNDGSFTMAGDYTTCAAGSTTQVYLYATGGNPGASNNSAIGLLSAIGSCTNVTSGLHVNINEATTIGAAYSFAAFASDPTHVSSSGTALAQVGIANAFLTAPTLSIFANSRITNGGFANGSYYAAAADENLNGLSDILAACVNSVDNTTNGTVSHSGNCNTLFSNTLSAGTTGSTPNDTAAAALNMAHNQSATTAQLTALKALISGNPPYVDGGVNATFQYLSFQIPMQYFLSGYAGGAASQLEIDGYGNVWVLDVGQGSQSITGAYGSLAAVNTVGVTLTGSPFGSQIMAAIPTSFAIDRSNNIWVANGGAQGITEFNNSGTLISASLSGTTGTSYIAFDGSGSAWALGSSLTKLTSSGVPISGANFAFTGTGIAIDGAGSVWIPNGSSITKLNNAGTQEAGSPISLGNEAANYESSVTLGRYPYPVAQSTAAMDGSGNFWTLTTVPSSNSTYNVFSNAGVSLIPSPPTSYLPTLQIALDGSGAAWMSGGSEAYATVGSLAAPQAQLSLAGYCSLYCAGGAVDPSGNLWVSNFNFGVTKFIGIAVPVITPIVAGLPSTFTTDGTSNLGTRP